MSHYNASTFCYTEGIRDCIQKKSFIDGSFSLAWNNGMKLKALYHCLQSGKALSPSLAYDKEIN